MADMPLPPVVLPRDERPTGARAEWWYAFGHLRPVDRRLPGYWSFVTVLLKRDFGPDAWLACTQVVDLEARRRIEHHAALGLPFTRPYEADGPAWRLGLGSWRMALHPDRVALFHQAGVTLDLSLAYRGEPALVGHQGVMDYGGGHQLAWYTRPFVRAEGRLVVGDREVEVHGDAWFERQWGEAPVESFAWRYLSLMLDNGDRWLAFRTRVDGHLRTYGQVFHPDGRTVVVPADRLGLAPVAGHPRRTRLRFGADDLEVAPLACEQLLTPPFPGAPPFYEGFSVVEGTVGGRAVRGVGMTELRGTSPRFVDEPEV